MQLQGTLILITLPEVGYYHQLTIGEMGTPESQEKVAASIRKILKNKPLEEISRIDDPKIRESLIGQYGPIATEMRSRSFPTRRRRKRYNRAVYWGFVGEKSILYAFLCAALIDQLEENRWIMLEDLIAAADVKMPTEEIFTNKMRWHVRSYHFGNAEGDAPSSGWKAHVSEKAREAARAWARGEWEIPFIGPPPKLKQVRQFIIPQSWENPKATMIPKVLWELAARQELAMLARTAPDPEKAIIPIGRFEELEFIWKEPQPEDPIIIETDHQDLPQEEEQLANVEPGSSRYEVADPGEEFEETRTQKALRGLANRIYKLSDHLSHQSKHTDKKSRWRKTLSAGVFSFAIFVSTVLIATSGEQSRLLKLWHILGPRVIQYFEEHPPENLQEKIHLAFSLYYQGNLDEAENICRQLLFDSISQSSRAKVHRLIGLVNLKKGKIPEGEEHLRMSLKYYEERLGSSESEKERKSTRSKLFRIYLGFAEARAYSDDLDGVSEYLAKAKEMIDTDSLLGANQMAQIHGVNQYIQLHLGNFEKALEFTDKALALYEERGNKPGITWGRTTRAFLFILMGDPLEGDRAIQMAQEQIVESGDQKQLQMNRANLALLRKCNGNLDLYEAMMGEFEAHLSKYPDYGLERHIQFVGLWECKE